MVRPGDTTPAAQEARTVRAIKVLDESIQLHLKRGPVHMAAAAFAAVVEFCAKENRSGPVALELTFLMVDVHDGAERPDFLLALVSLSRIAYQARSAAVQSRFSAKSTTSLLLTSEIPLRYTAYTAYEDMASFLCCWSCRSRELVNSRLTESPTCCQLNIFLLQERERPDAMQRYLKHMLLTRELQGNARDFNKDLLKHLLPALVYVLRRAKKAAPDPLTTKRCTAAVQIMKLACGLPGFGDRLLSVTVLEVSRAVFHTDVVLHTLKAEMRGTYCRCSACMGPALRPVHACCA